MNLPNEHYLQNGKYQLSQVIGQGGFGITYKGIWFTEVKGNLGTIRTEVPVCIKEYFFKDYCDRDADGKKVIVHSETGKLFFDKFKEKLIKEATILSKVHHPYIVNVLEVFEENNTAYIAMEYISGYSLKQILDNEGLLTENKALNYIAQIGSALSFVHENHILHLDIKPSNILIDKNNNARLIDFGVSKRYDLEQQETSTTTLTLSKGFASIEQYDGEGIQTFSPTPDVYSLGATLYNLLTGKIPTESILRVTKPLIEPRTLNPLISEKTADVILKAMEIRASDRYQSIEEMMSALHLQSRIKPVGSHSDHLLEEPVIKNIKERESEQEDRTILYSRENKNQERTPASPKTNRKKRQILYTSFLLLCVVGVPGIIFLKNHNSSLKQNTILATDIEPEASISDIGTHSDSLSNKEDKEKTDSVVVPPEISPAKEKNLTEKASSPLPAGITTHAGKEKQTNETAPVIEPKMQYDNLISSGKKKLREKDYTGAKADISLAVKQPQSTQEDVQLLLDIEAKIEEDQVARRKNLYELKQSFGSYTIVVKKDNGRYGAIDSKGKEIIPCKYMYVGVVKNGRVFIREDLLNDIYNKEGKLISEGQAYY